MNMLRPVRSDHTINQNLPLAVGNFIQRHQQAGWLLNPAHDDVMVDTVNFIMNRFVLRGLSTMPSVNPHHSSQPLNLTSGPLTPTSLCAHFSNGEPRIVVWTKASITTGVSCVLLVVTISLVGRFASQTRSVHQRVVMNLLTARTVLSSLEWPTPGLSLRRLITTCGSPFGGSLRSVARQHWTESTQHCNDGVYKPPQLSLLFQLFAESFPLVWVIKRSSSEAKLPKQQRSTLFRTRNRRCALQLTTIFYTGPGIASTLVDLLGSALSRTK